ncbi:atherin-like [Ananas comosus]|uniref:Atherin-like n=1 Tax=Ananas comosus TaxID=4615 RepID=A0A6P5FWB5_ANACO|nr:atherin-like [Ananas comosus]
MAANGVISPLNERPASRDSEPARGRRSTCASSWPTGTESEALRCTARQPLSLGDPDLPVPPLDPDARQAAAHRPVRPRAPSSGQASGRRARAPSPLAELRRRASAAVRRAPPPPARGLVRLRRPPRRPRPRDPPGYGIDTAASSPSSPSQNP